MQAIAVSFPATAHTTTERNQVLDGPRPLGATAGAATFGGMSKISLIAKLTAAEGKGAELEAVLGEVVTAAEEEAGLEIYSAHKDSANEGVYYFFELYTDGDALGVHGKGDAMKAAMGKFAGLLGGRPEITMMSPVVAKGMDI